ncbi:hypothetical protein CCR75_001494 [Bremia lactucae]|uniref:RING-type domain-containing protein n=1 Tax=Bremia lactucae TaxID=4779 RepID=A0A976IJQ4_BRELC|nr:hypothetical protein CCR75_001494 [Bremia lactucae]
MRQNYVLGKTSADRAQLCNRIRQIGIECKASARCGCLQRIMKTSPRTITRRAWSHTIQYDQCRAFQTFINDMALNFVDQSIQCEAMQRTRNLLKEFLEIADQRIIVTNLDLIHVSSAALPGAASVDLLSFGRDSDGTSDDSFECSICCGNLSDDSTQRLPCGHNYHAGCVRVWLNLQRTCPFTV